MSSFTFLLCFLAVVGLLCWGFPAKTNQSNTEAAFNTWAQSCRPNTIKHGAVVNDQTGERALVIVCDPSPGGDK